jgi:hypothetical protein
VLDVAGFWKCSYQLKYKNTIDILFLATLQLKRAIVR